jgi:hypothetical protein
VAQQALTSGLACTHSSTQQQPSEVTCCMVCYVTGPSGLACTIVHRAQNRAQLQPSMTLHVAPNCAGHGESHASPDLLLEPRQHAAALC